MRKVYVDIKASIILDLPEGKSVDEVISEIDIGSENIITFVVDDYEVTDSK